MIMFDELSEENFLLFAAKNYDNPACVDVEEFNEDLARFIYVKRLLRRYQTSGIIQERLLINHLIVLHNVFGVSAFKRMLFYRIEEEHWAVLKTILIFLGYMKESEMPQVSLDKYIIDTLRRL